MMKTVTEEGDKGVKFASNDVGALEVGGSIMTLLDPTDTLRNISGKACCFMNLFYGMHNIKDASNSICSKNPKNLKLLLKSQKYKARKHPTKQKEPGQQKHVFVSL